jgi:hypothetical protein
MNTHWINWAGSFDKLAPADVNLTSDVGPLPIGNCQPVRTGMSPTSQATMTVQIPAAAQSGDFVVFSIHSFHLDPATCAIPPNEDFFSQAVFGVYVP